MNDNMKAILSLSNNSENAQHHHINHKLVPSRESFIKNMYNKVYSSEYVKNTKPMKRKIHIENNHFIEIVLFDFKEVMIDLLSNEDIMDPNHLLFYDDNDPCAVHPRSCNVGEIITSDVFFDTHKRLCKNENDVLFPIVMYNDELNFDSYGKLKLDPFSLTFGRLPIHIRNQSYAWRYFGFCHNAKQTDTNKKIDARTKMKIYHQCLHEIFKELKLIQDEGGIPFDLKLKNGRIKKVNLILYVQFIIGDTKGHDQLCGRMASYNTGMQQMLRDCDVTPNDVDNLEHICCFRKINEVKSFTDPNQYSSISFHDIDNALYDVNFGDETHGIFGATPGEPLHILEMQLLEIIADAFVSTLPASSELFLQKTIIDIVPMIESQSIKDEFLPCNAFREGLVKVKALTGKERHAKIFLIYISLMFSECFRKISEGPMKNDSKKKYGYDFLNEWFELFEASLIVMKWLSRKSHVRKDLYSHDWFKDLIEHNDEDIIRNINDDLMSNTSPAQHCIIKFLSRYKKLVKRGGNGLKIPKFHLMLHLVRNICRHGAIPNYDGSRPEAIAKDLAKSPGLRTQKHHKSITIQTATRYHEDLTILEAERLYYQRLLHSNYKVKRGSSNDIKYSYFPLSKSDNLELLSDYDKSHTFTGSNFNLEVKVDDNIFGNSSTRIHSKVTFNGVGIKSFIDEELLFCVTNWLWINPIGGRIDLKSTPKFYTQMKYNGETYHCHPRYRTSLPKYDWVYVNWGSDSFPEPLPAKLYMLFDISSCNIIPENNQQELINDSENENSIEIQTSLNNTSNEHNIATNYLSSNTHWAVIHSVDTYQNIRNHGNVNNNRQFLDKWKYHIPSKISKRFQMEKNIYRIIPVTDIVGRALCFMNHLSSSSTSSFDNTCINIHNRSKWCEKFMSLSELD